MNREAELERPSRVACSDLLAIILGYAGGKTHPAPLLEDRKTLPRSNPFDCRLLLIISTIEANVKPISLQVYDKHGVFCRTIVGHAALSNKVALYQLDLRHRRISLGKTFPLFSCKHFLQGLLYFCGVEESFIGIRAYPVRQIKRRCFGAKNEKRERNEDNGAHDG